jgi:hypothetical protein
VHTDKSTAATSLASVKCEPATTPQQTPAAGTPATDPLDAARRVVDTFRALLDTGLTAGNAAPSPMKAAKALDAAKELVASTQEEGELDSGGRRRNPVAGTPLIGCTSSSLCVMWEQTMLIVLLWACHVSSRACPFVSFHNRSRPQSTCLSRSGAIGGSVPPPKILLGNLRDGVDAQPQRPSLRQSRSALQVCVALRYRSRAQ